MFLQQLNQIAEAQTLDFEANKNVELTLEMLKRTHKENDIYGRPLKGLYHYEAIERIAEAAESRGLMPVVSDLWAAQNPSKSAPGVALLPQVEAVTQPKSVEAHILRRVFCTLNLMKYDDGEKCTNIALTFHQDGVQVGIGQRVTVCSNQSIIGAERMAASRGNDRESISGLFDTVERWLDDVETITTQDRQRIEAMKSTVLDRVAALAYLGLFNCMRVAADSKTKEIRDRIKVAPLTQAQLSILAENLTAHLMWHDNLTLWEFVNMATEIQKSIHTDMPRLIPTNAALFDTIAAAGAGIMPLLNC